MSTTTLPNRLPAPPRDASRRLGATFLSLCASIWTSLWAAADRARLWASRLIAWFAAEPGRVRAAFVGVIASAATGTAVGVAVGYVAARVVRLMLGIVEGP